MLETVSWPPDLERCDEGMSRLTLQLYGQTSPSICPLTEEWHLATEGDNVPLYEYVWSLALAEDVCDSLASSTQEHSLPFRHADDSAMIWLLFPQTCGWRVCELAATIKLLRPLPHDDKLLEKVSDYWKIAAPTIDSVATLLGSVPTPQTQAVATVVGVLAKLRLTALPPVEGYAWSVRRVSRLVGDEIREGVQWTLPKSMFTKLGGRVTGSLLVYLQPVARQRGTTVATQAPAMQMGAILVRGVVRGLQDPKTYIPNDDCDDQESAYLQLHIRPKPLSVVEPALGAAVPR
jgi:hypothetical protein